MKNRKRLRGITSKLKMARNKRRRQGLQVVSNKRQKVGPYWIEDSEDLQPKEGVKAVLTILITRSEHDDHYLVETPKKSADSQQIDNEPATPSNTQAVAFHISEPTKEDSGSRDLAKSQAIGHDEKTPGYVFGETKHSVEEPTANQPQGENEAKANAEETNNGKDDDERTKTAKPTEESSSPLESPTPIESDGGNESAGGINPEGCDSEHDEKPVIAVVKSEPASGPVVKCYKRTFPRLPNGDCGDGIVNPYPKSVVADKYWAQRRRLFSRFDDGIKLDKEGWYSVTPEAIAEHQAERIASFCKGKEGAVVLDAFCGCGGNAIALALRSDVSLVVCVDVDRSKLKLAACNSSIYGVSKDKIVFVHANTCSVLERLASGKKRENKAEEPQEVYGYKTGGFDLLPPLIDAVFLSPPWGGPDYENLGPHGYDIGTCISVKSAMDGVVWNGERLIEMSAKASKGRSVAFLLPRNTNGISVATGAIKAGYEGFIEMEQNVLRGKLKTVTAYFGDNNPTNLP